MVECQTRHRAIETTVSSVDPQWLIWAKRLAAAAQNGLAYNRDPFNIERYQVVRSVAEEMIAAGADQDLSLIHI